MRITHISDTHNKHNQLTADLPDGDIIIHSGDISSLGRKSECQRFVKWFGNLPYTYKIFIAGNHDLSFQSEVLYRAKANHFDGTAAWDLPVVDGKPQWVIDLLGDLPDGVIYLENKSIEFDGVKIWGSPYSATFGYGWAFNVDRGSDSKEMWETIPTDTNIVVTHGPLFGVVDRTQYGGMNVGCEDLRQRIDSLQPDFHLSGHIHESYGYTQFGKTHCINGSNLSLAYEYKNKPVTFDYDFQTKEIQFI